MSQNSRSQATISQVSPGSTKSEKALEMPELVEAPCSPPDPRPFRLGSPMPSGSLKLQAATSQVSAWLGDPDALIG